jgi:hypothetical protein
MTEEEIILEQSVEIPTIPVKPGGGEEECPVCLEQFNQVYKQASFTLHHTHTGEAGGRGGGVPRLFGTVQPGLQTGKLPSSAVLRIRIRDAVPF